MRAPAPSRARSEAARDQAHDRRGRDAPAHLREREDRIAAGDRDVAGRDETDPSAEAAAVDQRHCRTVETAERIDRRDRKAREGEPLLEGSLRELLQEGEIGTGLKVLPVPAEDRDAHRGVRRERAEGLRQALDHGGIVGVVHRGTVDGDGRNSARIDLTEHHVFGHRCIEQDRRASRKGPSNPSPLRGEAR